jgi:four helix bundle protein
VLRPAFSSHLSPFKSHKQLHLEVLFLRTQLDIIAPRTVDIPERLRQLPEARAAQYIASPLLRSGTSPAPNYAEARGAESDKDFVHKLKVVLKELKESFVWLAVIEEGQLLPRKNLETTRDECTALCRITAASIKTVKARCAAESKSPGFRRG